ncbi:hypothetical protein ACQPXM_17615 [Kribbella sp. CA-253562]|uniref:hypothetical protein n=1 Tax=Kribbella sp. CA-253562 TaxID=3239942 RepID=UPI003D8EE36A
MSQLVHRPRFSAVGAPFWILAGVYVAMGALLSWSLSTWAISGTVGVLVFAVWLLLVVAAVVVIFSRTAVIVDDDAVTSIGVSGAPTTLKRDELGRVVAIGRLRGSLPGGVLLVVARDGRRIGAAEWLWGSQAAGSLAAAVAGGQLPLEQRPVMSPFDLVREFGVDPAVRRRPVLFAVRCRPPWARGFWSPGRWSATFSDPSRAGRGDIGRVAHSGSGAVCTGRAR